ncbi:hypothetical protein GQ53DRAFT_810497 [Thozetella sp. PMI_491]|nr:hypothetical protein GQ53DRAFT_810497 [Thozetella sp. PMI_491]
MAPVTQTEWPRQRALHSKSRNGCTTCKQRRVKCDEGKPVWPSAARTAGADRSSQPRLLPAVSANPYYCVQLTTTRRSPEAFHYFLLNRTLLASTAAKGMRPFTSSLGMAETDSTFFELTLCLAASNYALVTGDKLQETFLSHREALLKWVKGQLAASPAAVSVACISIISTMILSDTAAYEDAGANAHLKGVLALLEARSKSQRNWRFYDTMIKQIMMMALFIIFMVKRGRVGLSAEDRKLLPPSKTHVYDEYLHPRVPSIYTQLANEFLKAPLVTGSPAEVSRTDGPILQWLAAKLRAARESGIKAGDSPSSPPGDHFFDIDDGSPVIQGLGVFALTVGTVDWFADTQPWGPTISKELFDLRDWSARMLEKWSTSKVPMTESIAEEILAKLVWMESDEGLEVLDEISNLAKDVVHPAIEDFGAI